ncbi:MAG: ribonuclease Z [Defluviitaleaceae bacterium]|nr:ribonuclease Z [Defluviitaleaceae bacterium]
MLDISLLGTGGMVPLPNRFLSSMIMRYKKTTILVDCGEGTQVTLKMLGWGFKNIDIICLTHFHADHVAGLPGFLHTMANSGRKEDVVIIGPTGLIEVVQSLLVIARILPFKIIFKEINKDTLLNFGEIDINTTFLEHRIICIAYSFEIKRNGKFHIEKAKQLNIPHNLYNTLQNGNDVEYMGKILRSTDFVGELRKGFKITYCTDSRPVESLVSFAKDSDLFICEGIYADDKKINKAKEYKHMLFSEAATLAKNSNSKELWLTHFSPSLKNPEEFIDVAKFIFENSYVGYDRITKTFKYRED